MVRTLSLVHDHGGAAEWACKKCSYFVCSISVEYSVASFILVYKFKYQDVQKVFQCIGHEGHKIADDLIVVI